MRGCAGLNEHIEQIKSATIGQVVYAGEWHSHPRGHDCAPSSKDFRLFQDLKAHRIADDLPALMLIVGDNDESRWFVDEMPEPPATGVLYVVCVSKGKP